MEQKMAQGTGLTPRQEQLLDLAIAEPYFLKTFYLSGGTALSSWYLHHRESDDLDFFSSSKRSSRPMGITSWTYICIMF